MKLEELLNDIKSRKKIGPCTTGMTYFLPLTLYSFKHLNLYNLFTNITFTFILGGKVLHTIEFQK
jgi:hypothetical protein